MLRLKLLAYFQQVKMLNHIYGAACDHQYLMNAMPELAKRATINRPMSDEKEPFKSLSNDGDGQGICEECGGPLHLPRAPSKNKIKDPGKVPNKIPDVADIKQKPKEDPGFLDGWRDPLTTRIQLVNPPDENLGYYRGFNPAML